MARSAHRPKRVLEGKEKEDLELTTHVTFRNLVRALIALIVIDLSNMSLKERFCQDFEECPMLAPQMG